MSDELTAPSAPLPEEPTAILRHMRTETFPKMIAFYTPVLEYIDSLLARLQEEQQENEVLRDQNFAMNATIAALREDLQDEIAKNNYVFEQHDGTKASIADLCNYKKRMEQSESRAAALQKDSERLDYLLSQSADGKWPKALEMLFARYFTPEQVKSAIDAALAGKQEEGR